jgi:protein-tyrosine-phosphatase
MTPPTTSALSVDRADVERYAHLARHRAGVGVTRLRLAATPDPRPLDPERALDALPRDPNVLVLCAGNICRSPFAERVLRDRLPAASDATVRSAGFVRDENRPSPALAVETAPEFGVDLADHESSHVTPEALSWSDLVLVMDAANFAALRRRHRWATGRAWFLTAFADADDYEIADPHGEDRETFRAVYARTADAAGALADALAARHS